MKFDNFNDKLFVRIIVSTEVTRLKFTKMKISIEIKLQKWYSTTMEQEIERRGCYENESCGSGRT